MMCRLLRVVMKVFSRDEKAQEKRLKPSQKSEEKKGKEKKLRPAPIFKVNTRKIEKKQENIKWEYLHSSDG